MPPFAILPTAPPRLEGTVALHDGRQLGYAEFGDPRGPVVFWFHGMPGARRQFAPSGRSAADRLGLRVISVERPGVGESSDHLYGRLSDWAVDVAEVADYFAIDRFMVAGLSAGGPYALACAHELPNRVVAVGLLGSLVPTSGEEAAAGGIVALTAHLNAPLSWLRRPLGYGLWAFIRLAKP